VIAQVLDAQSFQAQAHFICMARRRPKVLVDQSMKSRVVFGWSKVLFEHFRVINFHEIRILQPINKLLFNIHVGVNSSIDRLVAVDVRHCAVDVRTIPFVGIGETLSFG
jgi:hypothetical protein